MRFPPPVAPSELPEERDYTSQKFQLGTLTTVVVAHDYICPWCWVGWFHAQRLVKEFGIKLDWRGAELIPPGMEFNPGPPKPRDPDAPPPPPSRFDRFAEAEGIAMPEKRPTFVRSHRALLGAEYVSMEEPERFDAYNEAIYRGYWERGEDISDLETLTRLAAGAGVNPEAFQASVAEERYVNHIIPYDDDAYRVGIRHVPSFIFNGEELIAEAPYTDLAHAAERYLVRREKFLPLQG